MGNTEDDDDDDGVCVTAVLKMVLDSVPPHSLYCLP